MTTHFVKDILDKVWMRVIAPLVLVGITGLSINLLASVIQAEGMSLKTFLQNPWTYLYVASATLFGLYEYYRAQDQLDQIPTYYKGIMNDLKPHITQHCKTLIEKGEINKVVKTLNNTKIVFKFKKQS